MTDTNEYTGGSVSYYTASVTHPINEAADPYDAECIDIIDALQMTPNEANAFKALWRRGRPEQLRVPGVEPVLDWSPEIVSRQVEKVLAGECSVQDAMIGALVEIAVENICQKPKHLGQQCALESCDSAPTHGVFCQTHSKKKKRMALRRVRSIRPA